MPIAEAIAMYAQLLEDEDPRGAQPDKAGLADIPLDMSYASLMRKALEAGLKLAGGVGEAHFLRSPLRPLSPEFEQVLQWLQQQHKQHKRQQQRKGRGSSSSSSSSSSMEEEEEGEGEEEEEHGGAAAGAGAACDGTAAPLSFPPPQPPQPPPLHPHPHPGCPGQRGGRAGLAHSVQGARRPHSH